MTREEKQKAIDALKISAPIMAMTQEEFNTYIQTLNKVMDWLEQEPCGDAISRSDAIRVASGYCHWSNIPDELAKLPSVNPIPCDDAISRQAAIDAIENEQKKIMRSDWAIDQAKFSAMSEIRALIADLPSVSTKNPNTSEIEQKCDRINSLASVLPYAPHREIQELLCEIMDLCKAESEDEE